MKKSFISRLTKPRLLYRIWIKIRSYFYLDQWVVLIAPRSIGYESLAWKDFKTLFPPRDRFWADPFPWIYENKHYLFIEELFYSNNRGHIVCLALDEEMNILSNQVVLERPYHLSYPFLIEHEGQLYMIPETRENNGVELYRCTHFPDEWVFDKTLMDNVYAVDTTLFQTRGKWWLFANIQEGKNGSTWDTLNLYFADHPFSDHWTPHPLNPIVRDIHSARPAGRMFLHNGNLIRPSQDCSVRYGYATRFNHVTTLSETDYAETCEYIFKPLQKSLTLATHTFNQAGGLTAIDSKLLRRRF